MLSWIRYPDAAATAAPPGAKGKVAPGDASAASGRPREDLTAAAARGLLRVPVRDTFTLVDGVCFARVLAPKSGANRFTKPPVLICAGATGACLMYETGQQKRAKFPTSKAPISAVFHSFRLIFGRAIISRKGLEAWMLFAERARAEHSR